MVGSYLILIQKGTLDDFKQQWSDQNIKEIKKYIMENNIKEVWVAWGDDNNIESLKKGKQQLQEMLSKNVLFWVSY